MGPAGRRKRGAPWRAAAAAALAAALVLALPSGAAATIEGGCIAIGSSTSGGAIDLTATSVWHVRTSDEIAVTGSAPFEQFHGDASAYAFGFAIPLANGESEGETSFESDTYQVATLALLGRVFVIAGSSSSAFHGCDGTIEIVVDDVNPFLTVLGGGGLAGVVLGLLGLLWALSRPTSARRRAIGLLALALFGAGLGLLLQQTATPGEAGLGVSAFVASVASPVQVSVDPTILVQGAILTAMLVVLMPFPSELFNSTLEANHEEIRGWFARLPIIRRFVQTRPQPRRTGWWDPVAVAAFILVSGLLYGLLDPAFGLDAASVVTFVGIVAALVAVTLVAALPRRSMQIALTGDRGRLRAVPGTLLIAAACVLISRIAGFLPGYLYGLILGYEFVRSLDDKDDVRAIAAGAWWMIGLALVSWFALGAVRTPGIEPSVPAAVAESVFASFVVAGIEGIVFGLVPLRFLNGEPLFRWQRLRWGVLYALGMFAFLWIILNPSHGFVSATPLASLVVTIALFVGFGLVSVLFWAYFRFRRRPPAVAPPAV